MARRLPERTSTSRPTGLRRVTPCFNSIEDGLVTISTGHVLVLPGTYNESVDLGVVSEPQGPITIEGIAADGTPAYGQAIVHGANAIFAATPIGYELTVQGLTLESSEGDGMRVVSPENVHIVVVTANDQGNGADGGDSTGDDGFDIVTTDGANITVTGAVASGNTGPLSDGFQLKADGDVTITDSEANNNTGPAISDGFNIFETTGAVSITSVTANGNKRDGVAIQNTGPVTITDATANDNLNDAFHLLHSGDDGLITFNRDVARHNDTYGFYAETLGPVAISDSTATDNTLQGLNLYVDGAVTIARVTMTGNTGGGISALPFTQGASIDTFTMTDSLVQTNDISGVYMADLAVAGTHRVSGSIICGHEDGMGLDGLDATVDVSGNWWGDATAPSTRATPVATATKRSTRPRAAAVTSS